MDPTSTASSVSKPPLPFLFDPNHCFDSRARYPCLDTPPSTIGGVTTHYHVDTFVDSINNAIAVYGSAFVKDNIHHCLRGDAFRWYSTLAKVDKDAIQKDPFPSLYQWIGRLQLQFHSRKPLPEPPRFAPTPARTRTACPLHAKRGQTYYHPAESCRLLKPSNPSTFSEPTTSQFEFAQTRAEQIAVIIANAIISSRVAATSPSPESPPSSPTSQSTQKPPSNTPTPKSHDTAQSSVTAPIPIIRSSAAYTASPPSPPSPPRNIPTKPTTTQTPTNARLPSHSNPLPPSPDTKSPIQATTPPPSQARINAVLSYIRDARIDFILARIKSTILQSRKASISVRLPPPTPPPTPPTSASPPSPATSKHHPTTTYETTPSSPSPATNRHTTTYETTPSSIASLLPYALLCVMLYTLAASTTSSSLALASATPAIRSTGSTSF
jgi:hypothetical protein